MARMKYRLKFITNSSLWGSIRLCSNMLCLFIWQDRSAYVYEMDTHVHNWHWPWLKSLPYFLPDE